MSHAASSSAPSVPRGHPIGTILIRFVVPLWIVAGASVKLWTFNPALLPEPILDLVKDSAGLFGVRNLGWWLEMWLRFFIATEFAAALAMLASPRLARFLASFILAVFLAVLVATMAKSAQREGISAIWSGSCGCFGSASPPPIAMFLIDACLLLGVIFIRPVREPGTPLRFGAVVSAVAVGAILGFGRPRPVIKLAPQPPATVAEATGDSTNEATPAVTEGWGAPPEQLEPFYFTEFSEWVGKPLSAQPIARLVSRPLPDWIDRDRCHLVLYRADCENCHALLEDHFSGPLETPVIAVEIPDSDPEQALAMPCDACLLHELPAGTQYVVTTPVLLTVENGVVLAVCENSEDPAEVAATIAAGR
ncbi:MAG: hypothetical protein VX672_05405 [Planctomycetota bacterium]|nr:hypothetical protein [Planctomycetota bacterium]